MLRRVTLVRTDVSEELEASFNRVKRQPDNGGYMFSRNVGYYRSHTV
jgi:hypothetical protein